MSRLSIVTENKAQITVEKLYKALERRIVASPPGLCPVDLTGAFIKMCLAQTCGKCVPCRIGLRQLSELFDDVLDGRATLETIDLIKNTAESIYLSSDCAIGYEAAAMVLRGMEGYREDFEEHINHNRCICNSNQPVPCKALCPAGVDIPGYISLVGEGRYADAVKLIRKDNPMPVVCGLICEHPCENRCKRGMLDYPVNIRGLKRVAVDNAGEVPIPPCAENTGKKVAIVGGGPGGLSAAYYLALMGHNVTIYEQRKRLGGMLSYGIPNYRLPRELLERDINAILSAGIEVHKEVSVGKDISMVELQNNYDAIYIAIGAHTDKKIGIEGEEEAKGVISAVEMLRNIGDGDKPDYTGKKIVVIGGGNVAMDVARSSVRLGAESVSIVYRRRKADMTALPDEIEGAIAEGCELYELMTPVKIETDENSNVKYLHVQPQMISKIKNDRPGVVNADAEMKKIECDLIIVAVGQGIQSKTFEDYGIPVKRGAIEALSCSEIKNFKGIFAGGDCVTGPATVIRAIAAGKVAAANIDEYLGFNHEITCDVEIPEANFDDKLKCGRVSVKERDSKDRVNDFELAEIGMSCEEACQEANRCLRCDHFGYGVFRGGRIEKW
ncbi:NADPH-dependent glutamate synthase beta chain [Hathewaya proteolytica DSM 3090]|uniref:NADPH-dependent glutamate synthase beta chain n=1 Tax=Hathewaya proteolytica DSM 3090 TaxID=1121331 RepID=A0A1M6QY05_9CLOT|nr:NAD(P)-binding protein [Hathewaya proteolytica]SHK25084.1 NADPH-dependent glutamate synthase beta chain [Hathewaya proteolytica DSM 3090]